MNEESLSHDLIVLRRREGVRREGKERERRIEIPPTNKEEQGVKLVEGSNRERVRDTLTT